MTTSFLIICLVVVGALLLTSVFYKARINALNEQLRIARNKIIFREVAGQNIYNSEPMCVFNDRTDSWDVVLGVAPYRFTIASFPCGEGDADAEYAKALAEDLVETLKRFRYYAYTG